MLITDTNIGNNRWTVEYGNPFQHFCPVVVCEMVKGLQGGNGEDQRLQIHRDSFNCVTGKTCDIMDPYPIITWVLPNGGGGPNDENL